MKQLKSRVNQSNDKKKLSKPREGVVNLKISPPLGREQQEQTRNQEKSGMGHLYTILNDADCEEIQFIFISQTFLTAVSPFDKYKDNFVCEHCVCVSH